MNAVEFVEPPPLPSWLARQMPWRRRTARIGPHRVHFVDHQAHREHAVLLMHGHPTWSYLWRKVIARLSGQPVRIIAPDLVGLGFSSKPEKPGFHSLATHIEIQTALVRALDLKSVTIVGQDWGGPVVTGVGYNIADRVRGIVLGNTAVVRPRHFKSTPFHRFSQLPVVSDLVLRELLMPVPVLWSVQGDRGSIGPAEMRAYAYPLRHRKDRAAMVALPRMVPNGPNHPTVGVLDTVGAWLKTVDHPASLVWGLKDPILGRSLGATRRTLPHAVVHETGAGHFLQEEVPDLLAREILRVSQP